MDVVYIFFNDKKYFMMFKHLKKLHVLRKLEPIIMLSHMRANTSLFGHILGSNPAINGYYEMHIGYYSWRSLVRQKLKYLESHQFKPGSRYIFDKILHGEHAVNCSMLKEKKAKIVISIRDPLETIPSIMKLYSKFCPEHKFAGFNGSVEYYKSRLVELESYSKMLKNSFIYLDANNIKNKTDAVFRFLENELNLTRPLSAEYDIHAMTGVGSSGDHSSALKEGKIVNNKHDYADIEMDADIISELNEIYGGIRQNIISNSSSCL